ncbi:MAG TPA: YsnF/AvaK domain-containing protein [Bdellovibrionota bacterium]|nr:YsnF/AvaK domain-containing protein [Bdellovibrionota bacterium]
MAFEMRLKEFLSRYPEFSQGQKVRSSDDENLGSVQELQDDLFVIEKGFFFPRDFAVRYDDVKELRDGIVYLNLRKEDLREWTSPSYAGWSNIEEINRGKLRAEPRDEYKDRYSIPVSEEELEARKTVHEAGKVKLKKIVHTEYKHFTVPVTKEEIRIERTPGGTEGRTGEQAGTFKEEEISIPLTEERVEVTKRPVVKEEIHVSKEQRTEQQPVSGMTRKEEVHVEDEREKKKRAG